MDQSFGRPRYGSDRFNRLQAYGRTEAVPRPDSLCSNPTFHPLHQVLPQPGAGIWHMAGGSWLHRSHNKQEHSWGNLSDLRVGSDLALSYHLPGSEDPRPNQKTYSPPPHSVLSS